MTVNNQQIVKRFCDSRLLHQVNIPNIRKKLYEKSAKVFQACHEDKNVDKLPLVARQYTNVLKEQIQEIEQYYGPDAVRERKLYQELERLWALCEVLYFPVFSNNNSNEMVTALMKWYNKSYTPYLLEFNKQSIYYCQSTLNHAEFWPYAARLVVSGELEQLSKLFTHALSGKDIQNHLAVKGHLQELNNIISQGIENVQKHHDALRTIFNDLNQLPTSIHASKMITIIALLLGDERTTLQNVKDDIQAFISCSYYQFNNKKSNTIHESAEEFFSNHNYGNNGDFHQAMRLFIQGDIFGGLEHSSQLDWWFIAHLADLLHLKKMLNRPIYYESCTGGSLSMEAREYLLLTYGAYLNNQFELWKESFTYLITCGDVGKNVVVELLMAMDFQNDDTKLNDVVKFCINYSMKNDGLVLYEKKATTCLALKEYKKALQYYNQAEKYHFLDEVYSAVLEDFIHTGHLYDIKSLSLVSDFQGIYSIVYRDISKINSFFLDSQFQSAADTFKSLLQTVKAVGTPKRIIPIAFAEGWKLIKKRAEFTLDELLEMKSVWTSLKNSCVPQDFVWYHYYINSKTTGGNSNMDENINGESENVLLRDMTDFFDTTAVIIARAIDQKSA